MGLFGRRKPKQAAGSLDRSADKGDRAHLESFIAQHDGVEAFVEPRTSVTSASMVLVARSGEWTRRRVPDQATAFDWAKKMAIPCYDANLVGYPQRMRDWDIRRAAQAKNPQAPTSQAPTSQARTSQALDSQAQTSPVADATDSAAARSDSATDAAGGGLDDTTGQ